MARLTSRLAALQTKLRPQLPTQMLGAIETHRLDAWPACKDAPGYEQCTEHGPTCGVHRSPIRDRFRLVVIMRGGPWLGLG